MGAGQSQIGDYNIPIKNSKKPGFTHIYRNRTYPTQLKELFDPNITTVRDSLMRSKKQFYKKQCMGTIVTTKDGDKQTKRTNFITYGQALERSSYIGSAIYSMNLFSQAQDTSLTAGKRMKFVGIYSKNRTQWMLFDWGCILYGITTVPLYDTLGVQNLSYCLNHTKMTTLFCSGQTAETLTKLKDFGSLKNIVLLQDAKSQVMDFLKNKFKIISFSQVLQAGKQKFIQFQKIQIQPRDCLTFSYTSGTTGPPKGAMLSHANFIAIISSVVLNQDVHFNQSDRHCSFLPLPHVYQRIVIHALFQAGADVTFYSGDVNKIKDDLKHVKPTVFGGVPRLYNRMYDAVMKKFEDQQGWTKWLVDSAVSSKTNNLHSNGGVSSYFYDTTVFKKVQAQFGGCLRLAITGSAPLKPEVHQFIKIMLSIPLVQVYGQTQNTGLAFHQRAIQGTLGHVGGVASCLEFKLADIPEMNYNSNDVDQQMRSAPRGQVWLRGPAVFLGYYKDIQKTKEALTPEGWLKTGDVATILPDNAALKIIDRKKNIFKLSQGQYIAPQKVQAIYTKDSLLNEAYLHGDSAQSFAVAIVVPDKQKLIKLAKQVGVQNENYSAICKDKTVRTAVCKALDTIGKKGGLHSFEQAKNVYIEPENFQAKNILTNTMKVQRFAAKKTYADQIKALYEEGMLNFK